ncbi:MAG: TolC family protein [Prevotella sp.]|nr:TolC family protein [Prevotella sp.]
MAASSTVLAQQTVPAALSLQQLKDSALRYNNAIRSAELDIAAAQQQRKEAFTKYFPNISGTALSFNANRGMAEMDIDPQEFINPSMAATLSQMLPAEALMALASPISMSMMKSGTIASVMAMQPLFAGGQIVNGNKLATVGEQVSQLQWQLSANDVERQTEQYYWQMVSLQEKQHTLDAAEAFLDDIYGDVDVAVRAGVALRNDLLQVQLRQNDTKSQRLKLQNGMAVLKMLIAQYCGLRDTTFAILPADSTVTIAMPASIPSTLQQLPEYQLLEKQVEAAALQKKLAVGKQLPSVAVGAGYNYHNLMEKDHTFAMIFATVSVPISDWWGGSHAIKRKKIEQQKAQDQLVDNAQLLTIRMQKALNDVVEAQQQLTLAKQSIAQAEENLRINRDRYHAGTTTMNDLLEAQLLLQQTRDKHTDAFAELQQRLLDYRQATGL